MPHLDICDKKAFCGEKDMVLCVHRFNFSAIPIHPGRALDRLNDFQVLEYFFESIRRHKWLSLKPKPLFILVTKDINFLQDAEMEDRSRDCPVTFYDDAVLFRDFLDDCLIEVVLIEHREGNNHITNLRSMISKLNKLWRSRCDS